MNDTLEFTYTLEPAEQARATALVERRTRGAWLWRWFGLPLVLLPLVLAFTFRWSLSILWPYLIVLGLAGCASLLIPTLRRRQAGRVLAELPNMREVTYRLEPVGLRLVTSVTDATISWDAITEGAETDDRFLMFVGRRFAYYLPKRVVGPRAPELRQLLRSQLGEPPKTLSSAGVTPVT